MDVLELHVRRRPGYFEGDPDWDEAVIEINGRELVDLVREVERPFALAEGSPDLAGAYVGIPANIAFLPSGHLLGRPEALLSDLVRRRRARKAALLMCECGEAGCWPLCALIEVAHDVVQWSDFEQPHRTGHHLDPARAVWRYDALGSFTFDRCEYERALRSPHSPP